MYAFIKHIKTSMEQLPAPTQVMGYDSFEDMKVSGHYNKLLSQFKEKVTDTTIDTVFKLRKMVNKLARDKQISRVSELEKRDYGIRSIKKNSRKLDKLVRNMNEYIDNSVNDDSYNNALGAHISLNRNNARYQIRLRSDMDSRERIDGIPSTLEHRTTYDRTSDTNRGISKFVHLALPLYTFAITLRTPTMEVSNSMQRGKNGEVSFKVPLPWDFIFTWTIELGKYMPKLLLEDFDALSEMKDYQDLLDYITEERRKEIDGEESMLMLDDEDRESDAGLVRRSYGYGRGDYSGVRFARVAHWSKEVERPRYPHPFISSHDTRTPCWAGWRGDLENAKKSIDIRRLVFLLKGWATIYNESSTPHHNINTFMLGLPKVAKEQGYKGTQSGWNCWKQHGNSKLCHEIECTLTNTCEGYQTYLGNDKTSEDNEDLSSEKLKKLEVNGHKLRMLSKEEKESLLDGSITTVKINGGSND